MRLLSAMRLFCSVAELRSFSGAARRHETSPAAASRQVSALEKHLGIRLLNRSTRAVELSEAGAHYYPRCRELIDQLDGLESEVGGFGSSPRGTLRLSVPMDFGLVSQKLGQTCVGCYASPDYLAQHGAPEHPAQLGDHQALEYALSSRPGTWRFEANGDAIVVPIRWQLSANNGRALASAAASGLGILRAPEFLVQDHLRNGSLLEVLQPYRSAPLDISAVYLHRRFKPAKISAFVEFLAEYFRLHDGWMPAYA